MKGSRLHLTGAHRALEKQIQEIEQAGVRGRTPGSGKPGLTPLPPETWARLQAHLARIGAIADEVAARHTPHGQEPAARQPVEATRRWIAMLLDRLEECIGDYDPAHIAHRCGPFDPPEEAARLKADLAAMRAELAAARSELERANG